MLMLSRIRDHLSHLGLCNFKRKDAAHSFALHMDFQHNAGRLGSVHSEKSLQDIDDELHRSVVVIDQNNLIQRRALELWRRFLDDQTRSISASFDIAHQTSVYRARHLALQDVAPNACGWRKCRQLKSDNFNKEKQMLERPSR